MAKRRRARRSRRLGQTEGGGGISPTAVAVGVGLVAVAGVAIYFVTRRETPAQSPMMPGYPGYPGYPGGEYLPPEPGSQTTAALDQLAADLIAKYGGQAADYIAQYGLPAAADFFAALGTDKPGSSSGPTCPNLSKYPRGTCAQYKKYGPRAHKRGTRATGDENCWYGWDGKKTTIWGVDPAVQCK